MVLQMCCGIIKVTRDKKIMSAIISCTSVYKNPLIICTENRKQLDYEIVETQNLFSSRERPFNLKRGGGGGGGELWFFSKKIFLFPMLLKKIF